MSIRMVIVNILDYDGDFSRLYINELPLKNAEIYNKKRLLSSTKKNIYFNFNR